MRSKALAVLFVVAIVGCGGGNDSKDDTTAQSTAPEQSATKTTKSDVKQPSKLVGARTKANVATALAYEKKGDLYVGAGGCQFKDIAPTKKEVVALAKVADPPNALVKNDSGTAAVLMTKVSYFCAIQAANHLKVIP